MIYRLFTKYLQILNNITTNIKIRKLKPNARKLKINNVTVDTLTHLIPLVPFYTLWKHQKTLGFLFSGGIETRDMKWVKGQSCHLREASKLIRIIST